MRTRTYRALSWPLVSLLFGGFVAAASPRTDPPSRTAANGSKPAAAATAARRATSILGAAWNADNSPIPNARLRLRNLRTGRSEATAVANEEGRFAFANIEDGWYVVELLSEDGKVLALGHPFTIAPGETVATFVRLGTKGPWYAALFKSAGAAAISAAALSGVTAIAPEAVRPVSAQR